MHLFALLRWHKTSPVYYGHDPDTIKYFQLLMISFPALIQQRLNRLLVRSSPAAPVFSLFQWEKRNHTFSVPFIINGMAKSLMVVALTFCNGIGHYCEHVNLHNGLRNSCFILGKRLWLALEGIEHMLEMCWLNTFLNVVAFLQVLLWGCIQ